MLNCIPEHLRTHVTIVTAHLHDLINFAVSPGSRRSWNVIEQVINGQLIKDDRKMIGE